MYKLIELVTSNTVSIPKGKGEREERERERGRKKQGGMEQRWREGVYSKFFSSWKVCDIKSQSKNLKSCVLSFM